MPSIKSNESAEAGFKRLVELESAYRTQRPSDQLHAIASYPHLFDEFPDPVIINTVILKLADYFRTSNNIQRHAILQVFKKSQPHLKKVMNVEETIRRISPQMHSNDPLSRAITLRVLGCMATIVYDRIDVYHNVIHSLDSSEAMEVSAAVYAADRICAQSQKFCAIISGKLAFMVRDSKTPLPLRRRLIRVFGHMFEDITLARLARKTCLDILDLNQDGEYTVAILRTLTRLASHSLVDVNQQIELLLQRAQGDITVLPGIGRVSLMCLGSLARKRIEFSPDHIEAIFKIALETQDEKTTLRALETLNNIFRLTSITTSILLLGSSGLDTMIFYIQMCLQVLERTALSASSSTSGSRLVLLECFSLLSVVLPSFRELRDIALAACTTSPTAEQTFNSTIRYATQAMEQFLVRLWSQSSTEAQRSSQEDIKQSKAVIWYWINLILEEDTEAERVMKTILEWMDAYQALLHMARQQPRKMHSVQEQALTFLEDHVDSCDTQTFILVFRALLTSSSLYRTSTVGTVTIESRISSLLERFGQIDVTERFTINQWELYQLSRYSLQAGWASLALVALKNQEKTVLSVPHALWLTSVQTVALIESSLQTMTPVVSAMATEESVDLNRVDLYSQQQMYLKILGHLEEIEAYQIDRSFHLRWCTLRLGYLQACQLAVTTLQLLSTSVSTYCQQTGSVADHSGKWSFIALPGDEIALSSCADKFNHLAHQYTLVRATISPPSADSSTFLAKVSLLSESEQETDAAVEILQTMCLILGFSIQRVAKTLAAVHSTQGSTNNDADMEEDQQVLDIDPLLIPLLYHQQQGQEQEQKQESMRKESARTSVEIFRASARLALGYMNEHLQGRDLDTIEKGISIVQQLVSQFISFPVPIPQDFFVGKLSSPHQSAYSHQWM
ncbi:hypothetical protein BGX28_001710 [Mortierella sp. GBA30]|nr:hypothetical protein BGX28_001710 [Mortierella sp. GBA30]